MNTITRESIVDALISGDFDIKILHAYCKEQGKEDEEINKFLHYLFTDILLLKYCYNVALEYFQIKYEIVLLYDKFTNLITVY